MSAQPRQYRTAPGPSARSRYMSGSAATMPDLHRKRALHLKKEVRVERPVKKEKKSFFQLPKLRTVILFGVLGLLVAGQYAAVQDMGYRINQLQADYKKVKAANELLAQEYAALGDLHRVEKIAAKEMGMVHPEKVVAYSPTDLNKDKNKGGSGA